MRGPEFGRAFYYTHLARLGVVAALYVVCTLALAPLSFGPVQLRLSEMLVLLCFYRRDYCLSMVAGCALANLFSPLGLWDVLFGTLATAGTCWAVSRCKNLWLASLWPVAGCAVVGLELHLLTGAPLLPTAATVMLGELGAVTGIGCPMFRLLEKNRGFMALIGARR